MNTDLGILGLGNRSTGYYMNEINNRFNAKEGGYSTCPFVMLNTNFNNINPLLPNQFELLTPIIKPYIDKLFAFGVKKILIPNITIHETIDRINKYDQSYFIHPLEIMTKELKNKLNKKPIVILGTSYTMDNPYIINFINKNGWETKSLTKGQNRFIDNFRQAVYNNKETKKLKAEFKELSEQLTKTNYLVIACTELSIHVVEGNENVINLPLLQINESIKLISTH